MICIPITAGSNHEALKDLRLACASADLVELRLDYIDRPDLDSLLRDRPRPVIVTNRAVDQGGMYSGNESSRIDMLKKAIDLGADYIDIEHDCVDKIKDIGATKLIVSYHNFQETPHDIGRIHSGLANSGAHIAKLVTFANRIEDNYRIFEMLENSDFPTISFCMGELGQVSRILSLKYGGIFTFASLDKGKESAPGQLTIDDLTNIYHAREIGKTTAVYGLIGNPVDHSMGHVFHNGVFNKTGVDARYLRFKVDDLGGFIDSVKRFDIKGLSVTIPHKESIIQFIDEVDPVAEQIGAVNTVINDQGRLSGCNTDAPAAVSALEEVMINDAAGDRTEGNDAVSPVCNRNVTIIGAGGAARAIVFGLREKGANITVVNRNHDRARRLVDDAGCDYAAPDRLTEMNTDILINTTSVGMFPHVDESPVPEAVLKEGMVVFDIIYNPRETKLLKIARRKGCTILDGTEMFIKQAVLQSELFTGLRVAGGPGKRAKITPGFA